ncbi:MAG: glucose 1-dehydrogenase [Mesorhizobium sp.]|uniref:SDR family NAD(P)-dependent oxidoreductase n=1 Tax=unclassified Mesorhizobium TaxID=325217 RepID=UPI000F7552F4|nr:MULTISPECIES: glucose 1-dehydrogenase [unclassified Mesorhizobium]AZO48975.1 glucose 1-dehydrogenase [Mesorhizobium sp. M4B.F.Ca.ET.058.02.1.1]RUX51303.1 glucose 1-dehydrogenase [Mesorhizobium sp. M4A.F.Ca.ET.050.02.1.1]RVC45286.1 glucose 1-dehydrogenase [Mesorhizobium sp. M4A.F.Ca.ET.090.04.2.1]RVD40641.1 glucose 1-dehydrogenase [Mesorhizobium sp. M4A.F.Ca.ET.020.02.1.1]RWC18672.1 MAG: glucose 1-dehydrogenase [Mesorhizobium sp.]
MADRLAGKIAIITGGGRGIGAGITQRFVEAGAKVAIVQRNSPPETMLNEGVIYVKADLSNSRDIAAAVETVVERFGGLDILVNNAGIMFEKTVDEMTEADWDQMMDINLKAPFLLTKAAMPHLRKRPCASIVNIGSIEGLASNPGHPAYSASKAGIHGFTAAVAVDHGHEGIRCNAIAPGWINSDLSEAYIDSMADRDRVRRELLVMHPVGRLGQPTDVGNLAVWLASDESAFVTGQVYVIDGGRTKKLPLPVS